MKRETLEQKIQRARVGKGWVTEAEATSVGVGEKVSQNGEDMKNPDTNLLFSNQIEKYQSI